MVRARRHAVWLLPIAALAPLLYRRAIGAYFFEDDFQWLVTRFGFHPFDLLHVDNYNHFYRPVVELFFYTGVSAFGRSAFAFHLVNVAVHAVNALLVYGVTSALTRRVFPSLVAALMFVSLPAYVDAVAWVGAIAEPMVTLFGCASLVLFVEFVRTGRRWPYLGAIAAFAGALLTHESGVTFFPLILAAGWLARTEQVRRHPETTLDEPRTGWGELRSAIPFIILLVCYGAIDVMVNRHNYVVEEGHYRVGVHAIRNVFDYVVALYVGKHNLASYLTVGTVAILLLWRGSWPVRFATAWIFVTLLPFAFFTWANTSRYVYTPAVGFAMLVGIGIAALDGALRARVPAAVRVSTVSTVVLVLVVRFCVFTNLAVDSFVRRAEPYRTFLTAFRASHPTLAPQSTVRVALGDPERLRPPYVAAMLQWEYGDPDLHVEFETVSSSR
jgi:hypothetical protein